MRVALFFVGHDSDRNYVEVGAGRQREMHIARTLAQNPHNR
jgi:ABC-type branched-subunit amino acid transport system ATPase component